MREYFRGVLGFRQCDPTDDEPDCGDRAERKESRAVSGLHDNQSGQRRRERCANALSGDDGALRHVEAPGVAHNVGHDHREDRTEDASPDPIEKLNPDQPCLVIGKGIQRSANGQDQESREEKAFVAPLVGPRADQHGHWHHDNLGGDDACRHQAGPNILVLKRKLLTHQRQHRGIGQMEQQYTRREDQERPACEQDVQS
jgi:hypothetical protein